MAVGGGAALAKAPPEPIRVQVGEYPDMDACTSSGEVTGLRYSLLAVRNGPGIAYRQVDELGNGHGLYLCDGTAEGDWIGVVYAPGKEHVDCRVSSPVPERQPYSGPCRSGWVHMKWVRVIAG
jgi:hypothetical protein